LTLLICVYVGTKQTFHILFQLCLGPWDRSGWVRKIWPSSGIWSPDRPSRSVSMYRLSYPGSREQKLEQISMLCIAV